MHNAPTYWYKNSSNTWVSLDSAEWFKAWPALTAPTSNPTLTGGDTINLVVNCNKLSNSYSSGSTKQYNYSISGRY